MKKIIICVTACISLYACQNNTANKTTASSSADSAKIAATTPIEFADSSYNAIGDKALSDFSKGDFDAFISVYTDDSHLDLANGDSVIGKAGILKYWKTSMNGVDSIRFNKPIYLPIKINESRQVQTGNYLLMWYDFTLY